MTNILIAEDEEFIASLYKLELEKHGASVTIAGNGQEALDALATHTFDLLLLDLMLPVIDGFEVLQRLRDGNIQIPTLVITNLSQDVDLKKCEELGAKDYIVKADVDAPDVWERVQKWIPNT